MTGALCSPRRRIKRKCTSAYFPIFRFDSSHSRCPANVAANRVDPMVARTDRTATDAFESGFRVRAGFRADLRVLSTGWAAPNPAQGKHEQICGHLVLLSVFSISYSAGRLCGPCPWRGGPHACLAIDCIHRLRRERWARLSGDAHTSFLWRAKQPPLFGIASCPWFSGQPCRDLSIWCHSDTVTRSALPCCMFFNVCYCLAITKTTHA